MLTSEYIEDIFLLFSDLVIYERISFQPQDHKPVMSFRTIFKNKNQLTDKQAKYVLLLLNKYKRQINHYHGIDISSSLDDPKWRSTFRTIDYTKSIEVVRNEEGFLVAKLKFPYKLKDAFEKEFEKGFNSISVYDSEERCRYISLLGVNAVTLMDFCVKNGFNVSSEFSDYVDYVEEVWQNELNIVPHCIIDNNNVELKNVIDHTRNYFDTNKKNNVYHDVLLARRMGVHLITSQQDPIFKIAGLEQRMFWTNSMDKLADILSKSDLNKVGIIVDRSSNVVEFIELLLDSLEKYCYNIENIRVCFRDSNTTEQGKEFNSLIKQRKIGGPIDSGKLFIFKHNIPKWAKKSSTMFDLMVTNSITVPSNLSTRHFINACHANITVSNYLPSVQQGTEIVEL